MSKHTPGAWSVDTGQHANTYRHQVETTTECGRHVVIARIPTPRGRPEEATANAHLIAAAPDMLEALRAYQAANRIHNDSESDLYEKGAAAIAKAQGKATP